MNGSLNNHTQRVAPRRQTANSNPNFNSNRNGDPNSCLCMVFLPEFSVIVCTAIECRVALSGDKLAVDNHLKKAQHFHLAARQKKQIRKWAAQLRACKLEDLAIPTDYLPIAELAPPEPAFKCDICGDWFTTSLNIYMFNQHHDKMHGKNTPKCKSKTLVQSWCPGRYEKYWQVGPAHPVAQPRPPVPPSTCGSSAATTVSAARSLSILAPAPNPSSSSPALTIDISAHLDPWTANLLQLHERMMAEREEQATICQPVSSKTDMCPWNRYTRWPQHFGKRHLNDIAPTGLMVSRGSSDAYLHLARVCMDLLFKRAERALMSLAVEPRKWLRSVKSDTPDSRPLCIGSHQDSTLYIYGSYWTRFIIWSLRMASESKSEAETKYAAFFTAEQWHALTKARSAVVDFCDDSPLIHNALVSLSDDTAARDYDQPRNAPSGSQPNHSHSRSGGTGNTRIADVLDQISAQSTSDPDFIRISNLLLDYIMTVLHQTMVLQDSLLQNPLMTFTGVLSIAKDYSRFANHRTATPKVAGLLFYARVLVFFHDYRLSFGSSPSDSLQGPAEVWWSAFLDGPRKRYMIEGSCTPIAYLVAWLAYGKHLGRSDKGAPKFYISPNGVTAGWGHINLEVDRLRNGLRTLIDECADLLNNLTFGQRLHLTPTQFERYEAIGNENNLWTVLQGRKLTLDTDDDEDNSLPDLGLVGVARLARLAMNDSNAPFTVEGGRAIRKKNLNNYLSQADQLLERLFCLAHLTAGMPPRSPEALSVKWCNDQLTKRGVIIFDGSVLLVTAYHKLKSTTGTDRVIARVLPDLVGPLFLEYIIEILPFVDILRCCLAGEKGIELTNVPFLWRRGNNRIGGAQATDILKKHTARLTGAAIGIGDWRHLAIGLRNDHVVRHLGRPIRSSTFSGTEDHPADDLIDSEDYGLDADETEFDDGDEEFALMNSVFAAQAAHSLKVDLRLYGNHVDMYQGLHPTTLRLLTNGSRIWHDFLRLSRSLKRPANTPIVSDRTPSLRAGTLAGEAFLSQAKGWQKLQRQWEQAFDPDRQKLIQRGMNKLFGTPKPGMRPTGLRDNQAKVFAEIMHRDPSRLVVMPTGSGKTILFALLAALSKGLAMQVVFAPFRPVLDDLARRLQHMRLSVAEWTSHTCVKITDQLFPDILLVSADIIADGALVQFLREAAEDRRIDRIFFDECHTIILDKSFRPCLGETYRINAMRAPIVLLTATLPPSLLPELKHALFGNQERGNELQITRCDSVNRRIAYSLATVDPREDYTFEDEADLAVQSLQSRLKPGRRALVFFRAISTLETASERLNLPPYHSDMTASQKDQSMTRFLTRETGSIMLASGALGSGVDIPGIDEILFYGQPFGLIPLVQAAGRSGRENGTIGRCTVLISKDSAAAEYPEISSDKVTGIDAENLHKFLNSSACRIETLSLLLNGVAGNSCAEDALCDVCQTRIGRPTALVACLEEYRLQRRSLVLQFLQHWYEVECCVCHLIRNGICSSLDPELNGDQSKEHRFETGRDCPQNSGSSRHEMLGVWDFWRKIKLAEGTCYHCRAPQHNDFCQRQQTKAVLKHARGLPWNRECRFKDVVGPLVWFFLYDIQNLREVSSLASQPLVTHSGGMREFAVTRWLGNKNVFDGMSKASNVTWILYLVVAKLSIQRGLSREVWYDMFPALRRQI